MKRIKDSVHGNILVKDEFVKTILDTPSFQRLRRIEQSVLFSHPPVTIGLFIRWAFTILDNLLLSIFTKSFLKTKKTASRDIKKRS